MWHNLTKNEQKDARISSMSIVQKIASKCALYLGGFGSIFEGNFAAIPPPDWLKSIGTYDPYFV